MGYGLAAATEAGLEFSFLFWFTDTNIFVELDNRRYLSLYDCFSFYSDLRLC